MPRILSTLLLTLSATAAVAQPPKLDGKPAEPKSAASRVTAVTVYTDTALVTREVTVPDAAGPAEVVVTPLPTGVVPTSLYAEGTDGVRVLTARFRSRAVAEDNRAEVRALEAKIKEGKRKVQALEADAKALDENTKLLGKLETFTAATLQHLTEKGQLDAETTIALATYIRETRAKAAKEEVALAAARETVQEEVQFAERLFKEKAGGVSRTERDAVIVIDKAKAGPAVVRLNYLVTGASWRPQYKLRAGTGEKASVTVEYLASVTQQTGEDWPAADLTLSTAQPLLNAAPPDLRALEVVAAVNPGALPANAINLGGISGQGGFGGGGMGGGQGGFGGGQGGGPGFNGIGLKGQANSPAAGGPGTQPQAAGGGMPSRTDYLSGLDQQARGLQQQAQSNFNSQNVDLGNTQANQSAAIESYRDLVADRAETAGRAVADAAAFGPSVTYRLKAKLTVPARTDDQVIEIARLDLAPKFYYKAVPVLTPNVYRLADLTNSTEYVLLPGEATMYLGTDFVGQTRLPLVAAGKPFTVGFGVDPQLQASRKLTDKSRTTQGGNQVVGFKYRILINSYKPGPVDVQVWDRLPHAEAANSIAVTVAKGEVDLSKDALYLRDDRPKNLLRWDVKVDPKQNGEKALALDYEYKMEFAQTVNISAFLAK